MCEAIVSFVFEKVETYFVIKKVFLNLVIKNKLKWFVVRKLYNYMYEIKLCLTSGFIDPIIFLAL